MVKFSAFFLVCLIVLGAFLMAPFSYAQEAPKGIFSQRILSLFSSLSDDNSVSQPTPTSIPLYPVPTVQTPLPTPVKNSYKIAIIGDSMVDTMGEVLEYLEHDLKEKYPTTKFELYNYGQGAQNVEDGLARFLNEFNYQDRHYPSLLSVRPDIMIIGSFAYNPFSPDDPLKHKELLKKLVSQAKGISDEIYILAEIAPLRRDFGKGPNGVNWDQETAFKHSARIIAGLENALIVANEEQVSIINAYHPSIVNLTSKEGKKEYVNTSDGIHPSIAGHEYIASLIASTLRFR